MLPNAVSSYGNESADAIFFDGFLMAAGYFLMLAYTCIMLGPLRCVENRVLLSLAGVVSVVFGFIMSIGIASVLNYPYTLVHAILPFLCLGIGIDDMFVIIQCLNNVKRTSSGDVSIETLMADTMAHAGVSITVTSVTDVVAFGVGYFTNMPGNLWPDMRSHKLYSHVRFSFQVCSHFAFTPALDSAASSSCKCPGCWPGWCWTRKESEKAKMGCCRVLFTRLTAPPTLYLSKKNLQSARIISVCLNCGIL